MAGMGVYCKEPIEPVGHIPARSHFCVELIREFYLRGNVLAEDEEIGAFMFETYVCKKRILVTPHTIGELLGLNVDTSGFHYTSGEYQPTTHWDIVVDAICKDGTRTNRVFVESKDLRPEYHILSLIICYNVLPTIGTKRIRWDRLVLLYLLGHPKQAYGLNINVPFLMWQRMVHVIQSSRLRELLQIPTLITRILQDSRVDVSCDKYDFGLGPIDEVTLAKSISTLKTFQQTKGPPPQAASSAAPRHAEREGSSSSEGVVTLDSLHREMSSLKKGFKRLEEGMKRIMEKLGCRHDDVFPSYTQLTSTHPLVPPAASALDTGRGAGDDDDDDDEDEDTEWYHPYASVSMFYLFLLRLFSFLLVFALLYF